MPIEEQSICYGANEKFITEFLEPSSRSVERARKEDIEGQGDRREMPVHYNGVDLRVLLERLN